MAKHLIKLRGDLKYNKRKLADGKVIDANDFVSIKKSLWEDLDERQSLMNEKDREFLLKVA